MTEEREPMYLKMKPAVKKQLRDYVALAKFKKHPINSGAKVVEASLAEYMKNHPLK